MQFPTIRNSFQSTNFSICPCLKYSSSRHLHDETFTRTWSKKGNRKQDRGGLKERENGWNWLTGEDHRVKIDWESFSAGEMGREGGGGGGWVGGEKATHETRTLTGIVHWGEQRWGGHM